MANRTNLDRLIGGQVRARRERLGLSLQNLSDRLYSRGVSLSKHAIAQIETDKRAVKVGEAYELAHALDISLDHLTTGATRLTGDSSDVSALLDLSDQLDELVDLEVRTRLAIADVATACGPYLDRLNEVDVETLPLPDHYVAGYKAQAPRLRKWQADLRGTYQAEFNARGEQLESTSGNHLRDLGRAASRLGISPVIVGHMERADQLRREDTEASSEQEGHGG